MNTLETIKQIEQLLLDLYDPTDCSYDHHGNCQTHGWVGERECPQKRIRKLIKTEKEKK